MVQVTFDTKNDSLEELQQALAILKDAIGKRGGSKLDMPSAPTADPAPDEETALDIPFLKITVNKHEEPREQASEPAPTLNQLLSDESLSDDDFSKMLKEQLATEKPKEKHKDDDNYIEIIEYTEEKE